MKNNIQRKNSKSAKGGRVYHSYIEWQNINFPELFKKDKFEQLRKDTEKLATTLADDTFNQIKLGDREP